MLNERYLTLRFRQQTNYIIVFGLKKVKRDMMVNKKKICAANFAVEFAFFKGGECLFSKSVLSSGFQIRHTILFIFNRYR